MSVIDDDDEMVEPVTRRHPDYDMVDEMKNEDLVIDGFGGSDGKPIWSLFIDAIEATVVSLPNSTARNINPLGSIGNILKATLPSLNVGPNFDSLEEKEAWRQLHEFVSRTTQIGIKSRVQKALAAEGKGRVLCRGKIPMKSGDPATGVWISVDPKPGGHVVGQFEKLAKRWANGRTSVLDWGQMAYERQPKAAKHLVTALEGEQKEIAAAIAGFRAKALAVAADAAASNGAVDADEDNLDDES